MCLSEQNTLAKASCPAYSTSHLLCMLTGGWLLPLSISRSGDRIMQAHAVKL